MQGDIWDLHGALVISLCMRPFTNHQVCLYDNTTFPYSQLLLNLNKPIIFPYVTFSLLLHSYFQAQEDLHLPSSMRSGRMRIYIPPFYVNSLMSRITSLLACKRLERTSPARIKKHSKSIWRAGCCTWIHVPAVTVQWHESWFQKTNEGTEVINAVTNFHFLFFFFFFKDMSALVKTTDLWFEHVWRNFGRLQVRILKCFDTVIFNLW